MYVPWRKRVSRTIRGQLRSLSLSSNGIGIVTQTRNGLLVVDPRDFGVSKSLLSDGSYDWPTICWLSALLDQQSRIAFVGAHLGALLVPLALQSGSRDIVAFEPSPGNHQLLKMNLALNTLTGVIAHHLAVGDREGTVGFTENRINSGNSRISMSGEIAVRITPLDAVLPTAWQGIDLLVMDTEGFEVHAMRGGLQSLARTRYFYVEYAPEQLIEQGSTTKEFIELVASRFDSMYLLESEVRFFPSRTYVEYLQDIPSRRGLLLNLLFSNDAAPEPTLLSARDRS